MSTSSKGIFISFEGIDGCGKSTQVKLLLDRLSSEGYATKLVREPGGTDISEKIRKILLNKDHNNMSSRAEALLMTASRAQLTKEEITRCENDPASYLNLISSEVIDNLPPRKKDTKYTPLSLRQEKPYAILWLIKRYPTELSSSQIARLTGSTKNTVESIHSGTYREAVLDSKSPMDIGLCSYKDLEKALNRSRNKKIVDNKIVNNSDN